MKKLLSVLLVLILIPASVFAVGKIDLAQYTDAELYELLDAIRAELAIRNKEQQYRSIDKEKFYKAEYVMQRFLEIDTSSGKSGDTRFNEDYYAHTSNGIRIIDYDGRVVKASVQFDLGDSTNSVLRLYLLASIFEGKLYEKDSISDSDKHIAFSAAQTVVDSATDSWGMESLKKVALSYQEGYSSLATTGKVIYNWEYLDNDIWLSAVFCNLPDGIY